MIVTRPRGAIVTNPARRTAAELDQPNLRYAAPLDRCRQHQVELYTRGGRRFARLFGEDREALQARADRWRAHISPSLEQRWPES
ncbi:hypothetical protein [Halomonas sp. M4R1S46]|uniref:hypothetical protein n=1 Tax=Halomonas sp. M4R1S46 TaxID=2982692 RepID=UPI0021E4F60B|nr:hypothetical protein [Halomonas sp. M4R1S46]UYG08391.1 hypothetical protein OCT48_03350 [Halomonas sp. M4R1S46]